MLPPGQEGGEGRREEEAGQDVPLARCGGTHTSLVAEGGGQECWLPCPPVDSPGLGVWALY